MVNPALFFPDTSTLISLFDESDPLHERASEAIRGYKVCEVFIPNSVLAEWQSRTIREHKGLVMHTVLELDKKRKTGVDNISTGEFNALVDNAANNIRKNHGIESRKLDRARVTIQEEINKYYETSSGSISHNKPITEIKKYLMRLSYRFFEQGMGVIVFFIKHGYSHPGIKEETEKKVKEYISQHKIDLETSDAMIFVDLIRYVAADIKMYDFVVGDKAFYTKGQKYVNSYDELKSRVNFIFLSSSNVK